MPYSIKKTKVKISTGTTYARDRAGDLYLNLDRNFLVVVNQACLVLLKQKNLNESAFNLVGMINPYTVQVIPHYKTANLVVQHVENVLEKNRESLEKTVSMFQLGKKAEEIFLEASLEYFLLNKPNSACKIFFNLFPYIGKKEIKESLYSLFLDNRKKMVECYKMHLYQNGKLDDCFMQIIGYTKKI